MTKEDISCDGYNGSRGRGNFGKGGGRSNNQEGEMKTYNFCKKLGHKKFL
jgi:hypothetical protein